MVGAVLMEAGRQLAVRGRAGHTLAELAQGRADRHQVDKRLGVRHPAVRGRVAADNGPDRVAAVAAICSRC